MLISKHPIGQPIHSSAFLSYPTSKLPSHPVIFDSLDGASIRSAALHTNGSAGPSGLDALGWRRLCTSFQRAPLIFAIALPWLHENMYNLC